MNFRRKKLFLLLSKWLCPCETQSRKNVKSLFHSVLLKSNKAMANKT